MLHFFPKSLGIVVRGELLRGALTSNFCLPPCLAFPSQYPGREPELMATGTRTAAGLLVAHELVMGLCCRGQVLICMYKSNFNQVILMGLQIDVEESNKALYCSVYGPGCSVTDLGRRIDRLPHTYQGIALYWFISSQLPGPSTHIRIQLKITHVSEPSLISNQEQNSP